MWHGGRKEQRCRGTTLMVARKGVLASTGEQCSASAVQMGRWRRVRGRFAPGSGWQLGCGTLEARLMQSVPDSESIDSSAKPCEARYHAYGIIVEITGNGLDTAQKCIQLHLNCMRMTHEHDMEVAYKQHHGLCEGLCEPHERLLQWGAQGHAKACRSLHMGPTAQGHAKACSSTRSHDMVTPRPAGGFRGWRGGVKTS